MCDYFISNVPVTKTPLDLNLCKGMVTGSRIHVTNDNVLQWQFLTSPQASTLSISTLGKGLTSCLYSDHILTSGTASSKHNGACVIGCGGPTPYPSWPYLPGVFAVSAWSSAIQWMQLTHHNAEQDLGNGGSRIPPLPAPANAPPPPPPPHRPHSPPMV